jgi:exodeoxyribonuclease-5
MRQKEGNPIIESSVKIRKNITNSNSGITTSNKLNQIGEGIEFVNLNSTESRSSFRNILEKYYKTDKFNSDSEYCKMIGWRNKTVSSMNDLVRKVIYGEEALSSKILIGEKLIANSPIMEKDTILFNTNDEFSVVSFETDTVDLRFKISDHPDDNPYPITLKYYDAKVSYLDEDDDISYRTIQILHEDSEYDFKKLANILKVRAINKKGKDKSWLVYYNFLRRYADVNFSYAITVHESQGSTYNTIFVLEDDIDLNWNIVERNRIKYTAYTRASRKLYVIKRY